MPTQSIDLSAVTETTFNGSDVEQINLNGSGIWTKPPQGPLQWYSSWTFHDFVTEQGWGLHGCQAYGTSNFPQWSNISNYYAQLYFYSSLIAYDGNLHYKTTQDIVNNSDLFYCSTTPQAFTNQLAKGIIASTWCSTYNVYDKLGLTVDTQSLANNLSGFGPILYAGSGGGLADQEYFMYHGVAPTSATDSYGNPVPYQTNYVYIKIENNTIYYYSGQAPQVGSFYIPTKIWVESNQDKLVKFVWNPSSQTLTEVSHANSTATWLPSIVNNEIQTKITDTGFGSDYSAHGRAVTLNN